MQMVELRSGAYRARVAPAAGGRIASLAWRGDGGGGGIDLLQPWDGAPFDQHAWPKAGAFPMLPFANRLPAQGFRFAGRVVQPQAAPSGIVQHGVAHRRAWRLLSASQEHARMRLDVAAAAAWPWAWSAEMDVSLGVAGMTVAMRVCNASAEAMPLGMGWHPYHPVAAQVAPHDLVFDAAARHALDAGAKAVAEASVPEFRMLPGETSAFSGWTGGARLRLPGGGRLRIACTGARELVLHRPQAGDYLCIEPVTVLPGHLGEGGASGAAGVLGPGETRQLAWTCGFEPAA